MIISLFSFGIFFGLVASEIQKKNLDSVIES